MGRSRSVDTPNKAKETPLLLAAQEGFLEIVKLLLTEGKSDAVNSKAADGRTPLISAARFGFLPVCKVLLENGADRTVRVQGSEFVGSDGTAADVAEENEHTELAALLRG